MKRKQFLSSLIPLAASFQALSENLEAPAESNFKIPPFLRKNDTIAFVSPAGAITLEEIAIELERYFGKKVTFLDSAAKTYRLTGSFENNSLEEIMYYLSQTKDFNYKITNSELLISVEKGKLQ